MFATRHDSRSLTPARYAHAVRGLYRSLPLASVIAAGAVHFPPVRVMLEDGDLHFTIRYARSRSGGVWFFADGEDVLLPGAGRDRAREIVRSFVSLLNHAHN